VVYLAFLCRDIVALVLLLAGSLKLTELRQFISIVRAYKLIPDRFAFQVGSLLAVSEVLIGLGLFSGISVLPFLVCACALFVLFATVVTINLVRGNHNIPCGCFGAMNQRPISWYAAGRSTILGVIAVFPSVLRSKGYVPDEIRLVFSERLIIFFIAGAIVGGLALISFMHRSIAGNLIAGTDERHM
jgi:uncharacterized membrane protein